MLRASAGQTTTTYNSSHASGINQSAALRTAPLLSLREKMIAVMPMNGASQGTIHSSTTAGQQTYFPKN